MKESVKKSGLPMKESVKKSGLPMKESVIKSSLSMEQLEEDPKDDQNEPNVTTTSITTLDPTTISHQSTVVTVEVV